MAGSMAASTSYRQWQTEELCPTVMSAIAQEASCDAAELKIVLPVPANMDEERAAEIQQQFEAHVQQQQVTNTVERSRSWIVESQLLEEDSFWVQLCREDRGLIVPPHCRDGQVSTYEGDRDAGGITGWQASLLCHALAICRCRLSAGHSDMESDGGVRRAHSRLVSDVTQRSSIVSGEGVAAYFPEGSPMSTLVVQEWQLWEGRKSNEKGNAFISANVLHVGLKSIAFQCAANFGPPFSTCIGVAAPSGFSRQPTSTCQVFWDSARE
eukprot:6492387-Amphidinium_carterae.4